MKRIGILALLLFTTSALAQNPYLLSSEKRHLCAAEYAKGSGRQTGSDVILIKMPVYDDDDNELKTGDQIMVNGEVVTYIDIVGDTSFALDSWPEDAEILSLKLLKRADIKDGFLGH